MSNLNLDVSERQVEFGVEQEGPIKVRLGSNEMVFADGHWIPDKGWSFPPLAVEVLFELQKRPLLIVRRDCYM